MQKLLSLIRSHLSICAFVATAFGVFIMKSLPVPMSSMLLPRLSPRVFIVNQNGFYSTPNLKVRFNHDHDVGLLNDLKILQVVVA